MERQAALRAPSARPASAADEPGRALADDDEIA